MTGEQGLGQSSHVLTHVEKQPQTGTSFNHNMTFLNQPAVTLNVKQSLPQCQLKGFHQQVQKSLHPLLMTIQSNELITKNK